MKLSSNNFSKKTITKSSNTFAAKNLAQSSATFAKKTLALGSHAWEGENLTSGIPGIDFLEEGGIAPGIGEPGGIAHFKNRDLVTPTH